MQIILLERVGRLGGIGDEVHVRNGYARNYLLPQGKALRATDANRARFETERSVIEARNAELREAAKGVAGGIDGKKIVVIRQAGENGQLYGSVSSRDIAEALSADGTSVTRSQVDLNRPIKSVGLHEVTIRLHAEVESVVLVNVARSPDEAERQAAGEDLTVVSYEQERAPAPAIEKVFEEGLAAEAAAELSGDETDGAEEATADMEAAETKPARKAAKGKAKKADVDTPPADAESDEREDD